MSYVEVDSVVVVDADRHRFEFVAEGEARQLPRDENGWVVLFSAESDGLDHDGHGA